MTQNIDYSTPSRTVYGVNSINVLAEELKNFDKNILYITSRVDGDHLPFHLDILDIIKAATKKIFIFDEVEKEPYIQSIDKIAEYARKNNIKKIIAVGGGSVIDTGKGVSILCTNSGSIRDYQMGEKEILNKGVDIIAVPTTAGTGAEATKVAVITNNEKKIKKSILHPYLVPYLAILDPNLTKTLPHGLTALTGVDALSHAVEAYTSTLEIPFAKANAIKAIELIGKSLIESYKNPDNLNARLEMLIASYLGGLSLIASVGAAHRLAQPISAETGLSHSEAISVILINVMEINRTYCKEKFRDIAAALGADISRMSLDQTSKEAVKLIKEIFYNLNINTTFKSHGIDPILFPKIIENADNTTSHLIYNPRPINNNILLEILNKSK